MLAPSCSETQPRGSSWEGTDGHGRTPQVGGRRATRQCRSTAHHQQLEQKHKEHHCGRPRQQLNLQIKGKLKGHSCPSKDPWTRRRTRRW